MNTIKELKELKTVKAIRIDNNYQSNDDIIQNFELQAKNEGYEVKNKTYNKNINCYEYELINNNIQDELCYSVSGDDKLIQDILQKQDRKIIKYELEENKSWLYVTVQGKILNYNVRLNPEYLQKELHGELVFKSHDYYFQFIDHNGNIQKFYNFDGLKKDMLQNNKIVSGSIEYILNI